MIDLPHVAARVFGTPLMMARGKLEVILGVLGPRLAGQALAPVQRTRRASAARSTSPADGSRWSP